jgi:hypothetical protein
VSTDKTGGAAQFLIQSMQRGANYYQRHVDGARAEGIEPLAPNEWLEAQKFIQQKVAQARLK